MKKTARTFIAALLAGTLLVQTGLSAWAAADVPASEAPVAVEEATTTTAQENAPAPVEINTDNEADTEDVSSEAPVVLGATREDVEDAEDENNLPLEETQTDEVSSKEVSPAMTLTARTYNGIEVEVKADEGVLPEDAHLFVAEIRSSYGKQTAEEALDATDIEYDDYLLMDIQIRNGENEEIEPEGDVHVNIMMDADRLPEDADASTLEIHHLEENSRGEVEAVRTVADNGSMTGGDVDINGENMEADFTVPSFSYFTITWRKLSNQDTPAVKLYFDAYVMLPNKLEKIDFTGNALKEMDIFSLYPDMVNGSEVRMTDLLEKLNLETVQLNGQTYPFVKAIYNGIEFVRFKTRTGQQNELMVVRADGSESGISKYNGFVDKQNQPISLYFGSGALHPVDTVDSTKKGIEMHLFKFDGAPNLASDTADGMEMYFKGSKDRTRTKSAYGGTKHLVGMLTQGLVTNNRIAAGEKYPRLRVQGKGQLASVWFDKDGNGAHQAATSSQALAQYSANIKKAQQVNRLFREDIYRKYGYFYYGSDENGVELDVNGDFHVYEEVVTSSNYSGKNGNTDSAFYYRRGQFLPYNHIDPNRILAETMTDMAGNVLDENDPLYKKPVYAVKENEKQYNDWDVLRGIMYFGMSVETTFYQPVDGIVPLSGMDDDGNYYNPNAKEVPMMFRFNGDDDFWLFIDDVLVLDLGGVHDAQEGWINFQTGDIYFSDNGNYSGSNGWQSDQSIHPFQFVNYDGSLVTDKKYDGHTTIYDQFVKALGKAAANDLNWKGNTFADNTRHTMKIYYMEHGAGASNLRMMFNIPVEKVNDLKVGKSFTENGKPKEFPDDFVGTFEVYEVIQKNGASDYTIHEKVGEIELNKDTAIDGTFTRRTTEDGQAIYEYIFENLPAEHKYIVVEKIYRSDIGYLNTLINKSFTGTNASLNSVGKYNQAVPNKKSINASTSAIDNNSEPTHIFVSDVFVISSKEEMATPQLLEIENQYQTTLTIEKHVHSENEEDKTTTEFEFRLYLKNADGSAYTQPLGKPESVTSLDWKKLANGEDDLLYPAQSEDYYEFKLKNMESITLAIPNGIKYLVAENVGGQFRVFRPFINRQVVKRDDKGEILIDALTNDALWQEATKLLPQEDISGFKNTPEDTLVDDMKITFINERQIVRTGVSLNSAPFMMMLAMVFFAAAGLGAKYLIKKANEEDEV